MRPQPRQPGGAAPLPPILGAQVLGSLPACQIPSLSLPPLRPAGSWSWPLCAQNWKPSCYKGQGRGPGRQRRQQVRAKMPASVLAPWGLSRQNVCSRDQAGLKGATSLEPRCRHSRRLPPALATELHLNLAPSLSLGDLRAHRLWPGCQSPARKGVSSLPASSLSAQGQGGLLWDAEDPSPLFYFIHWFH